MVWCDSQLEMKINEKHLCELSTLDALADKRGYLQKRGEVNRAFQRRWFVLLGNLLFYFEKSDDSEPKGVIVLENCVVGMSESDDNNAFELSFGGSGTRTYVLAADTREEMDDWMQVLERSSCRYLQTMIAQLQRQVDDIGASPVAKPELQQTVAATDHEMSKPVNDSDSLPAPQSNDTTLEQDVTAKV